MKNPFKIIYDKLDEHFSYDDRQEYIILNDEYKILTKNFNILQKDNKNCIKNLEILNKNYNKLMNDYNKLEKEFKELNNESELEEYWNNKRPKITWTWKARPLFEKKDGNWIQNNIPVDPRIFFTYDTKLPTFEGTNDEIANLCLNWVASRIKYISDNGEFWQFAFETLHRREGDCEDGAVLLVNMMIMSGIPYWRVRLNAGDVQGGGHAYVSYLRESDNQWYVMDWCYWFHECKDFGMPWKQAGKYYGIWCSWNQKYCYGDIPKELR